MKLSKFKTSASLEMEGVWVNIGEGAEVRVARIGNDAYAKFLKAMHSRINSRGGIKFEGRKHSEIYQTEQMRDCWNIRRHTAHRVIVRQIMTPELRQRFEHVIFTED